MAPIPISSGNTNRHRLDRGGNRQINATIHRIAVTRLRCRAETQDYIAPERAEGKRPKEAIRCLRRHLARRVWHLLQTTAPAPESDDHTITHSTRSSARSSWSWTCSPPRTGPPRNSC